MASAWHYLPMLSKTATILALSYTFLSLAINTPAADSPSEALESTRPNVILFIADDVSWNDYGCYGNSQARTPNIDRLAEHGIRFTEAYLTASSCSPSRASIITGRYPHNNGKAAELHEPIAWNLPWFPALLRQAGYYTALVGKNHMRSAKAPSGEKNQPKAFDFIHGGNAKGNSGGHATWVKTVNERPKNKPFFFWFAAHDAHRGWDADKQWNADLYGLKHQDVAIPPFLSNDLPTQQDLASYYNEVTRFDYFIGQVVATLKTQDELDNTLILVMADNGRPFPRAKTRLHDSGMKTALVAHWPSGIKSSSSACSSLVSAIDIAPTILQLAGVQVAKEMQGVSIEPLFKDPNAVVRHHAFSEHNWHDYEAHGRSVRSEGFLYIRNYRPYLAWQGPADSVRSPSHVQLQALRDSSSLSQAQADIFLEPRPIAELYHVDTDPHQLHNLADDSTYDITRRRMEHLLDQWMKETGDSVPDNISKDSFHRETGDRIRSNNYRGTTPGEDRNATSINATGPQ